jgi:hypothetical protein
MTYEEIVSAASKLSFEQRLMLIEEIADSLIEDWRTEQQSYLKDAPIVRSLIGTLSPDVGIEDYWSYIDEKYGDALSD